MKILPVKTHKIDLESEEMNILSHKVFLYNNRDNIPKGIDIKCFGSKKLSLK